MPDAGRPLTIGTAGHVDHGKSALVRALTGKDTDRLPEEQERGLSIELGYARLRLPSGAAVSVVDVPGHERFVRTMVAGATGIDGYLMVVAADDGVMPQTREHLAVLRGLGVDAGVVAVSKCDAAEPGLALEEVAELMPGTERVAVSARTGHGLADLRGALARLTQRLPGRSPSDGERAEPCLHVDRAFTVKGAGTVVTGTLWSGTIAGGDRVAVLPAGREARVRSIQVHDEARERAAAGQRVALNLAGLGRDDVGRGDVVTTLDSALAASRTVDVELVIDGSAGFASRAETGAARAAAAAPGAASHGARVQVHHGTRECPARLVERGAGVWQLRLEQALVPARGDRLILRSIAPPATLGGAVVVEAHAQRRRPREPRRLAPQAPGARLPAGGVARNGTRSPATSQTSLSPTALSVERELRAGGFEPPLDADLDAAALAALRAAGRAVRVGPRLHFHADALAAARERIVALLEDRGAVTVAELRDELHTSRKFAQALLEHLDREKVTVRRDDRHELRSSGRGRARA